jgi:transposase
MGMGRRRRETQGELWIAASDAARTPRHVFYQKLNELLAEAGFDAVVEELCESSYAKNGRPSIPPGVYFRMLLVGYFEGIDSQRGIAWRCADSLSLKEFLGFGPFEATPDHSSLTYIRRRLPLEVHERVFELVLEMAATRKLLSGRIVATDSTMLEADAAMKSIVRRESGEDWNAYLTRLMREEGVIGEDEEPTDNDRRKFDRARKNKKVSNQEWRSPTDPDARIAKMKDGRTHLAYKAEHTIDLESEFILDATIYRADEPDGETLLQSLTAAQKHLDQTSADTTIEKAAADKGYHKNETLADCVECKIKTYIPEPDSKHQRRWTNKPPEHKEAVYNNRRRMSRSYGKKLQRQRSELVERSFAHVCETGGARRTWLRCLLNVKKRYTIVAAGRNLGLLMGKLFGVGKPRCLQAGLGLVFLFGVLANRLCRHFLAKCRPPSNPVPNRTPKLLEATLRRRPVRFGAISTGC